MKSTNVGGGAKQLWWCGCVVATPCCGVWRGGVLLCCVVMCEVDIFADMMDENVVLTVPCTSGAEDVEADQANISPVMVFSDAKALEPSWARPIKHAVHVLSKMLTRTRDHILPLTGMTPTLLLWCALTLYSRSGVAVCRSDVGAEQPLRPLSRFGPTYRGDDL